MNEWKPIDSAPRDGTAILLGPNMAIGSWDMGAENWLVMNVPLTKELTITDKYEVGNPWFEVMIDAWGGTAPTHWMPLPEPPE